MSNPASTSLGYAPAYRGPNTWGGWGPNTGWGPNAGWGPGATWGRGSNLGWGWGGNPFVAATPTPIAEVSRLRSIVADLLQQLNRPSEQPTVLPLVSKYQQIAEGLSLTPEQQSTIDNWTAPAITRGAELQSDYSKINNSLQSRLKNGFDDNSGYGYSLADKLAQTTKGMLQLNKQANDMFKEVLTPTQYNALMNEYMVVGENDPLMLYQNQTASAASE